MTNKYLLPLGFIAVGLICIYPTFLGSETASRIKIFPGVVWVVSYKFIAGIICMVFGLGSLIYDVVKKK